MSKDAYYFPHDSNARNDLRIRSIRKKYKMAGYGIYFAIVEILREQKDYKLTLKDVPTISDDLGVKEEIVRDIITNFELFKIEGDFFYSPSLLRRMAEKDKLKTKLSEAGKRGVKARLKGGLINPQALEEKKGEEKRRKEKRRKEFVPPSVEEFKMYFISNGYRPEVAIRAWNGYNENNWHDSRNNPVLNWKSKCQNNWFKPEHELQEVGKPTQTYTPTERDAY